MDLSQIVKKHLSECENLELPEDSCTNPIDIEDMLIEAIQLIGRGLVLSSKVPPLIHATMPRGGKTTFLHGIFQQLKAIKTTKVFPIIIKLNGLSRPANETPLMTVQRLIGLQLVRLPATMSPLDFHSTDLMEYIELCRGIDGYVVLLIDDLNQLGEEIDVHLSYFLKSKFLDRHGYYLVATTNVVLDFDLDLFQRSQTEKNYTFRGIVDVSTVPTCTDLLPFKQLGGRFLTLTPAVVALWSAMPSLIYCHVMKAVTPEQRFNFDADSINFTPVLLRRFLSELKDGKLVGSTLTEVHRYAVMSKSECGAQIRARWPIAMICTILDRFDVARHLGLVRFLRDLLVEAKKIGSGEDWKLIVELALLLHCLRAKVLDAYGPFDIADFVTDRGHLDVKKGVLPGSFTTIDDAGKYIESVLKKHAGVPTLMIFSPQYHFFPDFDFFVICSDSHGKHQIDGYQVKLSRSYPTSPKPTWMRRAVLIRGRPPSVTKVPPKSWIYLSEREVLDFLGYSLSPLLPRMWLTPPSIEELRKILKLW